ADIRDLELLVNNAGFGTVGSFVEVARQKHDAMIQVHITALVRLTHAALPGMLARRKGHIINVSSVAGILPLRSELYGASKSFGITFSEALQSQLNGSGVKVQALCPGFTITEFHETPEYQNNFQRSRIPSFAWLNAEQVVRASLASLSYRGVICVPGFLYKIIVLFAKLPLSGMLIRYIGARFIR
ncbi:MAG: SDR family NAD(P)-dependent oxidoreductase, partial [Anaerolineales bacterium]|nr:SDR family NAD(P)-dependent oxidoreductase [Anaerolineales bacterium]